MRIISGIFRGKNIIAPEGENTRPTSDKARQAIFNMLENAPWSSGITEKCILDGFSGSGAFGIEALSRGALSATFIDNNNAAIKAIKTNIAACKFEEFSNVQKIDITKIGSRNSGRKFDIIFLDPPYLKNLLEPAISALKTGDWLALGAIVICEHPKQDSPIFFPPLEKLKSQNHGINGISIFRNPTC